MVAMVINQAFKSRLSPNAEQHQALIHSLSVSTDVSLRCLHGEKDRLEIQQHMIRSDYDY